MAEMHPYRKKELYQRLKAYLGMTLGEADSNNVFDRTIKLPGADGKMHIAESSWFDRGSLIMVQGMRSGDQFIAKKYKNSGSPHRLYKITEVKDDGDILLTSERVQGESDGE